LEKARYNRENVFVKDLCMKKFALVLFVLLAAAGGLFAQTNPTFQGAAPEFFSFDFGAGFGFALDNDTAGFGAAAKDAVGGIGNFGFKIGVLNNFNVGFDTLFSDISGAAANLFTGLRLAYNFIPQAGAALGIGTSGPSANPVSTATIGFFGNFFQSRSASGITTGIKLRIDFVAPFSDLGAGKIIFAPAFNIGL
jgi:hypothetical protein